MIRYLISLFFIVNMILLLDFVVSPEAKAAATVPLTVTVNGSLVITDADNDTMSGKDPTKDVTINITPDLGATTQTGTANFRIRTNRNAWRLTAQKIASNAGGTGLTDADVLLDVAKSVGTAGNLNSGTLVAPFNAQTNIGSITTTPVDVISGTAKTSTTKDGTNTNNYFQVNTTYSVAPDFFYSAGTFSTTITYNLVSP